MPLTVEPESGCDTVKIASHVVEASPIGCTTGLVVSEIGTLVPVVVAE
jgi:S-ribosylhomocysteine lyase LuxS involved in autoinducer biosynthesis